MKTKIKRVSAGHFAIVMGCIHFLFGLVAYGFFVTSAIFEYFASATEIPSIRALLLMGVIAPVLSGFMGFVMGAILAYFYNITAELTGGLKFDLEIEQIVPVSGGNS